jgi:hypothetical protein
MTPEITPKAARQEADIDLVRTLTRYLETHQIGRVKIDFSAYPDGTSVRDVELVREPKERVEG